MNALFVLKDKSLEKPVKKIIAHLSLNAEFEIKENLRKAQFKDKDLIVSVGGDGTMLSASHFIEEQLTLGVNSNPEKSEGALTSVSLKSLGKKLEKIIEKKFKVKKYTREHVRIFKQSSCIFCEYALNEVYIGNINPHHPSNYTIYFNKKSDTQRSSGILISTGTGSTAWYKAMGCWPFKRTKKQLRFVIREPFSGKIHRIKIRKGKVNNKEKLSIVNQMGHGLLAIDSIRTYRLHPNDRVEISLGLPLNVIQ
jgi:NAD+ kinase